MLFPLFLALSAAIIPTIIYVYLIWWCDRYEREPGWLLLIVFTWGAIPAILLSVMAELLLQEPFDLFALGLSGTMAQVAVISPVIEELAKGVALAGIFIFLRSEIDGVLDGIVYGALVGAGFAMTENFFYFLQTASNIDLADWLMLTFIRTVIFGLNHSFYTAITGAGFGYAALSQKRWQKWLAPTAGLILATVVHMIHNITTFLAASYPATLVLSILLSWGGILILVAIILLALRQEDYWIRTQLADEVPENLSASNYRLIQARVRRLSRLPAMLRSRADSRGRVQADLQQKATELAFQKHKLQSLGPEAGPQMMHEILRLRQEVNVLNQTLSEFDIT